MLYSSYLDISKWFNGRKVSTRDGLGGLLMTLVHS